MVQVYKQLAFELNVDGNWIDVSSYVSKCKISKTIQKFLDTMKLELVPKIESDLGELTINQEVRAKIGETGTYIFGGRIRSIKREAKIEVEVVSYGVKLNDVIVEEIYENVSPEYIVQDIIAKYTDLTYSSTVESGLTIDRYVADDKAINVVRDMANLLNWQIRTTWDKKLYFEPVGYEDTGITLTTGEDIKIPRWTKDSMRMCNKLKVFGDYLVYQTEETFTGDGTTTDFTLKYKPVMVRVLIDGVEQPLDSYRVNKDKKKISFLTAPSSGSNIAIQYGYEVPIVFEINDRVSQNKYGIKSKVIRAKWIKSTNEAINYAKEYISKYSEPLLSAEVYISGIVEGLEEGKMITITDNYNNIQNEKLLISKIEIEYPSLKTKLTVGEDYEVFFDWYMEALERIRDLEKRTYETVSFARYYSFQETFEVVF